LTAARPLDKFAACSARAGNVWPASSGAFLSNAERFDVNVTVENLAPCKKLVRVEVDAQEVESAYEKITGEFQKNVKLPGFRPGKVPKDMVLKNFSKQLDDEVRRRLTSENYEKALKDNKLHAVTNPDIEEIQFSRGQPMQFAATIETAPEFELPTYKGIKVRRETGDVTEADIDRALNTLAEQRAKFNDVNRPAQQGDVVVVAYSGTVDGKPLVEIAPTARGLTKQENFWMHIKEGQFLPGFTEQLVGASAGDKRTVTVTFPKDFVSAELSEKQAVYEVEIKQVKERILPAIDDAFAKEFKAPNLAELREGVRKDLQNELNHKRAQSIRNQAMKALLDGVNFDLPESVVTAETRNVINDIVHDSHRRGVPKENIEEQKNEIFGYANANAKERVKGAFILGRIADKEGIRVSQEDLVQRVSALAAQNQMPFQKMVKELQDRGALATVRDQVLVGKALEFVVNHAAIEEVPAGAAEPAAQPS
jgi:trigger factor